MKKKNVIRIKTVRNRNDRSAIAAENNANYRIRNALCFFCLPFNEEIKLFTAKNIFHFSKYNLRSNACAAANWHFFLSLVLFSSVRVSLSRVAIRENEAFSAAHTSFVYDISIHMAVANTHPRPHTHKNQWDLKTRPHGMRVESTRCPLCA